MSRKSKAPVIRPPGCGMILDRPNASFYGRRGGGSTARVHVYVEGSVHTYESLSKVLGLSMDQAGRRVRELRRKGLEITWSNLGLKEGTLK